VDLESVADELYSLTREKFTAARNTAAKRASEQGHRELAKQIGALRRPSTAAWLANLLTREHPDELRALVQLGDGLREAQQQLQGAELRRLSQQRHELVHALVQQAQALARTAGHPASDAVTRELVNTFIAAVNSANAAKAVAGGRLTTALDPADAAAELFATADAVSPSQPHDVGQHDEQLCRDLERLRDEAADAATARNDAQRTLTDAGQAVEAAATTLRELRARLQAAEQAEHDARRRAQSTRREFEVADRAAREAQQRMHDLEHRLATPPPRSAGEVDQEGLVRKAAQSDTP
jgi:DNA repair exonuclease SbcCD ATPase subunit